VCFDQHSGAAHPMAIDLTFSLFLPNYYTNKGGEFVDITQVSTFT
jgi:hypothetical protein